MSSITLSRLDGPADAELISAVRGGDIDAYGELFARHVDAARRLSRQLVSSGDVDDLVSDAFAKVLGVLQRGGGPDVAFRAYLLTALRRLHIDRIRATSKLHTTGDLEPFDPGVPFRDTAVEGFESAAAARAFASLPERWQLVLWHTEVEGQKPAEVAALLGMSANSVAALAYRAREGLRQAFLNMHVQELDGDECRWTNDHIGAYIRKGISRRDATRVEAHLDDCRQCMGIYLELTEVNSNLSGILAPLILGSAAAGYLSATTGVAAKGGLLLLADRARDVVAGNTTATAVAGVAVTAVIAGTAIVVLGNGDEPAAGPEPRPGISSAAPPTDHPTDPPADARPERSPAPITAAPITAAPTPPTTAPPPAPPQATPAAAPPPAGPPPVSQPLPQPQLQPDPESEPDLEPQPEPEPEPFTYDLVVTARGQTPNNPVHRKLFADVSGLPEGYTATLKVTFVDLSLPLRGPCPRDGNTFTCTVTANGEVGPFEVVAPPGKGIPTWHATFTVSLDGEGEDTDESNNSTTFPH